MRAPLRRRAGLVGSQQRIFGQRDALDEHAHSSPQIRSNASTLNRSYAERQQGSAKAARMTGSVARLAAS